MEEREIEIDEDTFVSFNLIYSAVSLL